MNFERPTNFLGGGSSSIKWIDRNFPNCPFCKSLCAWEVAMSFSLGLNRYCYRCPNCMAVISVPVATVEPSILKKIAGSKLRIEDVGKNQQLSHLIGTEHELATIQGWLN